MKLRIGILQEDLGWINYFQQEGLDHGLVEDLSSCNSNEFPILIAGNSAGCNRSQITAYIEQGGIVLFESGIYTRIFVEKCRRVTIRYQIPAADSIYSGLGPIDIYQKICYPVSSQDLTEVDQQLGIFMGRIGKGCFGVIPYDLGKLFQSEKYFRKKFYYPRPELPSERVAAVSRSALREVVTITLKMLSHEMDLPFIQKWYFPEGRLNQFLFRLDTDFCSREDALNVYRLCRDFKIKATWFVDTSSRAMLEKTYRNMKSQEIALHCDRHRIFRDFSANLDNVSRGLQKLADLDFRVQGFAAPFGEWNRELYRVLKLKQISYSSEFALDYDDLPFYPEPLEHSESPLQIPVHPVSLGRLRRSHFHRDEMAGYYLRVIENCLIRQIPIALYHHPHHGHLDIFGKLFEKIGELGLESVTMAEMADWWRDRTEAFLQSSYDPDKKILDTGVSNPKVWIKISYRDKYVIRKCDHHIDLMGLNWIDAQKRIAPADIGRIRKWHWRDLLYDLESIRGKLRQ